MGHRHQVAGALAVMGSQGESLDADHAGDRPGEALMRHRLAFSSAGLFKSRGLTILTVFIAASTEHGRRA